MKAIQELFTSTLINTIFIAVVTVIVANVILSKVNGILNKSDKVNKTLLGFIRSVSKFLIYFFVCLFVASSLGIDTSSIVALASVLSAAIALAAQNILTNLFGGVTMLITHPFKVGDYVSAAGSEGTVQSIGMFYTVLNTVDNKVITIPNGSVSGATITNFSSEGKRRVDLVITASYDSKVEDVKKSINKAISMTSNIDSNDQFVRLSNYGSSAISYTIRVWTDNGNYWQVYFDLLENIKVAFDQDGIVMTYDHIIVHNA